VPSFGDREPRLVLVGLAPGAHGANRTGRPFTGDGAGPFLFGALHRAGFASSGMSISRGDGLELFSARITNAVRCAPPGNLPTPEEFRRCSQFLARELELAADARAIVCLGAHAWRAVIRWLKDRGRAVPRPTPRFGHGAEFRADGGLVVIGSFHPSQINTRTGRLTAPMLDAVFRRAREATGAPRDSGRAPKTSRHDRNTVKPSLFS
jgi:uracil-DNA glycosylase family 4